jgi:molecular chaperone DnaJ
VNHYQTLGLERKARIADVKRAYKRLARRHHPDLNPGDRRSEERFRRISEAYAVLSDPQKRRAYDRDMEAPSSAAFAPGAETPVPGFDGEGTFDAGDPGAFASFLSEFFHPQGGEPRPRHAPRRGDDVTRTIGIGFFDALQGLDTEIDIDAETPCGRCRGSGRVPAAQRRPCSDCAGTGRISRSPGTLRLTAACPRCEGEGALAWDGCGSCAGAGVLTRREKLEVRLPAGVDDGSRVRIPGQGRAGRNGGPPGDLFLVTRVSPHPFFRRIGDNIHSTVPITVSEAALGARLEVPTIDGRARMRIPPGTETGQRFRLRGKGAPSLRGTARGDHYVETRIATPRAGGDRARRLLEELGGLESGEDLRRDLWK